jgi:hypothetical protein
MEKAITIKREYNSLDTLQNFLKSTSSFECSKEYDIWDHRLDTKGQMEQCLVLKKSNMHAVKVYFTDDNMVKVNHIIPNKTMQAYFGKSLEARRSILEIIGGVIKNTILKGPQQKAFEELAQVIEKAA